MQSEALPCNAVVGSPRRGYWVSQSSPPDLRSGLPVGSYPVLAGQRENHREGFRFQPRARDNCRLKSLQFFSFLAFYPEPVTTELRQRTVTPTWQPEFRDEYRPALLYHTLRAITYSAPIFKRLLAVYSASCLLQQAGLALR